MARIIEKDQQIVISPRLRVLRMVAFGLVAGLLFWTAYAAINQTLITPLACGGQYFSSNACINASLISGNIGVIFVAIVSVASLIMLKEVRPLLISLPTAVILWPIGGWVEGLFWLEALAWSMIIFASSTMLFWLIARVYRLALSIVLAILLIGAIKVVTLIY